MSFVRSRVSCIQVGLFGSKLARDSSPRDFFIALFISPAAIISLRCSRYKGIRYVMGLQDGREE